MADQLFIVFVIFLTTFAGPAAAIIVLLSRKRRARKRRRSAIGIALLRGPGHSLREQLDSANGDLIFDIMLLMVLPLTALALLLAKGPLSGRLELSKLALPVGVVTVAFIAFMLHKMHKAGTHLDHLKAGYDAELAVGQELDQLMRQGAATFHDLPAEKFNIDHVVIAPVGVFAVETKGYTKPNRGRGKLDATVAYDGQTLRFPTWTTREPLEQAERQAAWLAKWLSAAVGTPVAVLPVLALPGWFVDRQGKGIVRVFSGKELSGLLNKTRGASALSADQVQQIAHQVEQRCRTVPPLYLEVDKAG